MTLPQPSAPQPPISSAPPIAGLGGQAAVRAAILFLAVVTAGVLVRIFREILSPLVVAIFLLLLIDALARDLEARFPNVPRWARGAVAGILIIAGFAAVTLLLVFQGPPFAIQLAAIEPHVNTLLADVTAMLGQPPITVHDVFRGADPSKTLGRLFTAARGAITYAGLVLIYLGFLIASRGAFSAKLDRLYDTDQRRAQARRVSDSIRNAAEQYMRLVAFKALAFAIFTFALMVVLGVHSALFIAFMVFLAAFVPIVGSVAGAAIPALVALAQFGDLTRPLVILVVLGAGAALLDNVLMPKLQGDELNIDPLMVLISIGFWGLMLGGPGVLLSTPLSVTLMAIAAEFDGSRWLAILISKDGEPIKEGRGRPLPRLPATAG